MLGNVKSLRKVTYLALSDNQVHWYLAKFYYRIY